MKITKFDIENFKGIVKSTIQICDEVPGNVVSLIGLNESGKTTILEAISLFITEDREIKSIVENVHRSSGVQDLVPKDKKAAFTGKITVKAHISIDDSDKAEICQKFLDEHGLIIDATRLSDRFSVERNFLFEDSEYKSLEILWSVRFFAKRKNTKKFVEYKHDGETRPVWLSGIGYIRELIPKIVYFPTFLFDFPSKIYLEEFDDDLLSDSNETSAYYIKLIQDVMDSIGDLSVQRHIVDRIKRHRDEMESSAGFIAYFFGKDEKSQIDAVMQQISNEMSRVIFGAWNEIFDRQFSNKRVQVDWFIDAEKGNIPYLQVSIIDGQSKYALSERSLGFRWFFSFLLFTQFRKNRKTGVPTLFLLDEPASNLHAKAQMKLLDSFGKIAGGNTYIVYSTHSHYMINPLWLEKAYIIKNEALDYDDDNQITSFSTKRTDIRAIKYRNFLANNPSRTTYFQPALDALSVQFSPLIKSSRAIIVEGKFDYHPFVYFRKRIKGEDYIDIFPANGAGDIGVLVNLFRGWSVDFRIVLDDDKAGRGGKIRYTQDYLVKETHVATLGDISTTLSGKVFEDIYQADVTSKVSEFFEVLTPSKRHYSLFFQELLASKKDQEFSETMKIFEVISKWVDDEFAEM